MNLTQINKSQNRSPLNNSSTPKIESINPNPFNDYRELLKFEFESRNKLNSAYSLRAFARDLGLSPSRLSEIFKAKQGLSFAKAEFIGRRLGYHAEKLTWFCHLVQSQSGRSELARHVAHKTVETFHEGVLQEKVDLKKFVFEIKWYHIAIRRMTSLMQFKNDPFWIAKYLGIKVETARKALQDLIQQKLVTHTESGQLIKINNLTYDTSAECKSSIHRIFRFLHFRSYMARKKNNPINRVGCHILTLDKKLYPELLLLIKDFENKVDHLTYKSENHDALISVLVSAVPLGEDLSNPPE